MSTDPIPVERGNLQTLFDIIVASLDFGSGFLDQEQTEILRRTAEQLGVDPMEATPSEYRRSFPHAFDDRRSARCCYYCGCGPAVGWHEVERDVTGG
jgi:hypothetical protein